MMDLCAKGIFCNNKRYFVLKDVKWPKIFWKIRYISFVFVPFVTWVTKALTKSPNELAFLLLGIPSQIHFG